MDHSRPDDGARRTALPGLHGEGNEPDRAKGTSPASVDVGSAMSYLAQCCPDCGGLFIWDDELGRFHESTGEEFCPAPESLQIGLPGELQEVADPAPLGGRHAELEDSVPVAPVDFLGFAARRDLTADRAAGEED
jgi:hypothetical protein